ncbi:MAG TPA: DUF6458 family protein [Mycobacteriales bacterium]|jgi:hypothetical protein|nr:DUF6458 family protein [Mycobacteriales bacterium]
MGIGGSIFLLALGAILAFAVNTDVNGLDLQVVGYILMAAGALGIVLFLAVFGPRNRRTPYVEDTTVIRDRSPRERDIY